MVLHGGYGIFYAVTPSIFTGTAFTQNGIQVQTFTFSGSSNIPVTYPNVLPAIPAVNRTPSLFVFAPNFKNAQTQQWNLSTDYQLGNNFAVTLGYLGVKGSHLPRDRDINLFPEVPVTMPIQGGGFLTFGRHPNGRPDPNFVAHHVRR